MSHAVDRTLRDVAGVDAVAFDERGLVPVVAQDDRTGRVLMVAWANREALRLTLDSGRMHFWSRSRGSLWKKGQTSGNELVLESLHLDCDGDTVLARVSPLGPACHTGDATCFGSGNTLPPVIDRLDRVLLDRATSRPEGSYTTKLLEDPNLRMKKLGEECAELVAALAVGDSDRAVEEAADLIYHALVALRASDRGWEDVASELERRAG